MTSIVEVIRHYQRSINGNQDNEARLLHCINKLYKLPIKVEHLQETGIGKTVNSLRKFNGEIGVAAKTLVTKWKAMVAAEEEPMETTSQSNGTEDYNNDVGGGGGEGVGGGGGGGTASHEDDEDENHNRNSSTHPNENSMVHREEINSKEKEKHKSRSGSSHTENSKHLTAKSEEKSSKHSHGRQKLSPSKEKTHDQSSKTEETKERDKSKTRHKSSGDHHKSRDCEKEREKHAKRQDEKHKSSKEQKEGSPVGSPVNKSKSHASGSKSKDTVRHSSSSASKDKDHRHGKHKSSSKDKHKSTTKQLMNPEHKSSPISSTSKSSTKYPDSGDRKRRNSDLEADDFKSPPPKVAKTNKFSSSTPLIENLSPTTPAEEEAADGSFDSSMGANFDDVLGMLNVPVRKSKKSSKSPSTPSSSTSTTSRKDAPTHSKSSISGGSGAAANKPNETKLVQTSKSSHSTPSTSKAATKKPDLLAPTTKLEPLDPSIALELPTISTNYRPMPLNQTVMDCVFNNNSSSSSSSKPIRTLSDAEAISHGISSKTIRTKIYSGVRTGQTFQVPSLFDMCIRILQKNIDALEYTGGVPFEVLKPVLERATPQQLYIFEEYNPYLMEDSDVLWQQHVSRNYRTKKRQENESWREMFIRCQEEEERRLSVLKDSIKASQKIAAAPIRKTQLAFVDSMVKPPRNILKKQEQFGTKAKLVATPAARVASLSSVTPNAAKTGDQRLKVPSTVRDHAQVASSSIRPKKAPLMQKTLQFIRGRHKR